MRATLNETPMPQIQLPIFPAGTEEINRNVGVHCKDGKVVYIQYSSLNDPDRRANIDERRALVAAAYRKVTHFPLDPALIAPVAAGDHEFVEDFLQHRLMELLPVPRGG